MKIFDKMEKEGMRRLEVMSDTAPFPEAEWLVGMMIKEGHEKVYLFCHPETKLKAAVGIHSRALSLQTLGGIRMYDYGDENEALIDVLRLSKAMTYKSAIAGVDKGGAKCIVWGDPGEKTDALLEGLAKEIERLKGEYIGGEDMNITDQDVLLMKKITSFVVGLPETFRQGKLRGSGNPAPVTALGVLYGMQACLQFLNMGSLKGKTVAIQGIGSVGYNLAGLLQEQGVNQMIITDIDPAKTIWLQRTLGEKLVKVVGLEEIFSEKCDIFAPCARGGVLNQETIVRLKCKIVAGAANNQLQDSVDGNFLLERGILYAPDYGINAGGLINVNDELHPDGYDRSRVVKKLESIPTNLLRSFWYSQRLDMPTNLAADMLAEEKIWMAQVAK